MPQWMAARLLGDMDEDNNPITHYFIDKVRLDVCVNDGLDVFSNEGRTK